MSVIKLRGLPWSCTADDIVKFMEGVTICAKDGDSEKKAIYLMTNADGRPSGEAFIEVAADMDLEAACNKNNALMGQRYIEGNFLNTFERFCWLYFSNPSSKMYLL